MKKLLYISIGILFISLGCSKETYSDSRNNLIIGDDWPNQYPGTALGFLEGEPYSGRVKATVRGENDKKEFRIVFSRLDPLGYLDNIFVIDGIRIGSDSLLLSSIGPSEVTANYYDVVQTDAGCRDYLLDDNIDSNSIIFDSPIDTTTTFISGILNAKLALEAEGTCNDDGLDEYIIFESLTFEVPVTEM